MKTIWRLSSAVLASAILHHSVALAEGNPEAGRVKASTCIGCHGIEGYSNVYPTYHVPKIGGQHEQYLVDALEAYQDGSRKHPTMNAQAASLSEQDIKDIAAFFAQTPKKSKP